MNVEFKVRGLEAVQAFIKSIPRGVMKVGLKAFTEYVIGNARHGLKHEEPYRYVSRAQAYGVVKPGVPAGYFSMKQFRYVAAITDGFTNFKSYRPAQSSDAWTYRESKGGYAYTITNPMPSAYWQRDDKGQARQLGLVGWRKVAAVIVANYEGARRAAVLAVNKWIKENR
jgi:hypothetical protein